MTTPAENHRAAIMAEAADMTAEERARFDAAIAECETFFGRFTADLNDDNGPELLAFVFAFLGLGDWLKKFEGES